MLPKKKFKTIINPIETNVVYFYEGCDDDDNGDDGIHLVY